jgi:hypothetical protein
MASPSVGLAGARGQCVVGFEVHGVAGVVTHWPQAGNVTNDYQTGGDVGNL